MELQILNRTEINEIVFNNLINDDNYRSISTQLILKIKISNIDQIINWSGIRINIDPISVNKKISFYNEDKKIYRYFKSPITNNNIFVVKTRFKAEEGLNQLGGKSFGIQVFFKTSKSDEYYKYDEMLFHPKITI